MMEGIRGEELVTGVALVFGLGLVAAMIVLERRPRTSLNPRLIPTTPVMFVGIIIAVLALMHFLTIAGIRPGR
jgi:hypothetical protein